MRNTHTDTPTQYIDGVRCAVQHFAQRSNTPKAQLFINISVNLDKPNQNKLISLYYFFKKISKIK